MRIEARPDLVEARARDGARLLPDVKGFPEAAPGRNEIMALQRVLQWPGFSGAEIEGSFGAGTRASRAATS